MELNFDDLINSHKNESCIIIGGGHNLKNFNYEKFKGKKISIGSSILRTYNLFKSDYLISGNNHFPVVELDFHLDFLNSLSDITWIMSDTSCYDDIWKFDKKNFSELKIQYSRYDAKHFNKINCVPKKNCCEFLKMYPDRLPILNLFESIFSVKFPFQNFKGNTVFECSIIISILLGFKKIFIIGVDLPKSKYDGKVLNKKYYGFENKEADKFLDITIKKLKWKFFFYYLKNFNFLSYIRSFKNKINIKYFNKSEFSERFNETQKFCEFVGKVARKNNIEIVNIGENSNLKNFKYFTTIDHKEANNQFKNLSY